jgi:hypothetical protein
MAFEQNISIPRAFFSLVMTAAIGSSLPVACQGAPAAEFMFRARVDGRLLEGKPLWYNHEHIVLLNRDGQRFDFHPKQVKEQVKTSPRFFGYSQAEMKSVLQQEFGKQFDVSTTRHYIVVHPAGERDMWAQRFEDLYNRFNHYFRIRGFSLSEPPYPLVAIVYRDQAEYLKHSSSTTGVLGHYDPNSNRVLMFDATKDAGYDWSENAATIIHEATHQTANNVGIHQRFAEVPRWLVEGLATMFEARGVWNAQYDRSREDRVNRGRLLDFRTYAAGRRQSDSLQLLLSSDHPFRTDATSAYAEAWALSFYLCETRPREYAAYLAKTASRAPFSSYSAAERMADFQDIFGNEMRMLDVKFLRFIEELK